MRNAVAPLVAVALLAAGCGEGAARPGPGATVTPTTVPAAVVATTAAPAALPPCRPGHPKVGIDLQTERILRLYNAHNATALVEVIGDGPVLDPSLDPGGDGRYATVAEWLAAGAAVGDRLEDRGHGFGEPFELLVLRRNLALLQAGIDHVTLALHLWANQDCELRVEAGDEISAPDPCRYARLFEVDPAPAGCAGPFPPRAEHVAVWTGDDVLVFGGVSGTNLPAPYRAGLGFRPETGEWRELASAPVALASWPTLHALWTGDRMLVVGQEAETWAVTVLAYDPAADSWSMAPPAPAERSTVGAAVWTGAELILAGGDLNAWDETAWGYDPAAARWRRLPDPPLAQVEGMDGVWTGSEAIFYGGYPAARPVAYDPATDAWRELAAPPGGPPVQHGMVWTGERVVVHSGHVGPSHPDRLLIYDPDADEWQQSAPLPIPAAERLAAAWTGDRLVLWGGYPTYGTGDVAPTAEGAAYFPATDTWEVLPAAPLAPRCDHTGTWTGSVFVVFGGMPRCGIPGVLALGDAAAYDPAARTWELLEP